MFGIVTPTALSVKAIKRGFKYDHGNSNDDHRDFKSQKKMWLLWSESQKREKKLSYIWQDMRQVWWKKPLQDMCAQSNDKESESKCMTQEGQIGPREKMCTI